MIDPRATTMLPRSFSTFAPEVDRLYAQLYWVSVATFVVVVGTMLAFVWRYRRPAGPMVIPPQPRTSLALELIWIVVPIGVLAYFFYEGAVTYARERRAPADALQIQVVARQWSWEFRHPNGSVQTNELMLPVGRPIRLVMTSADVVHSVYVPELRIQRDIRPGETSVLWFEATQTTGDRPLTLFCGAYCGAPRGIAAPSERDPNHMVDNQNSSHTTMWARVYVVPEATYDPVISPELPPEHCPQAPDPIVCWGERLYRSAGCVACHSVDRLVDRPAPTWALTWGMDRQFEDGTAGFGDDAYVRESIASPQARVVLGFSGLRMPAARFSERQLTALVAYIRSVSVMRGESRIR